MPNSVYDQLIAAGAPAIKTPFAYTIEADADRQLRIQITMTQGRQLRLMSQRVVSLVGVNSADVLPLLATKATECWDEIQATAGIDAIINAVVGSHTLTSSRPAAPFPLADLAPAQPASDDSAVQAADDPH